MQFNGGKVSYQPKHRGKYDGAGKYVPPPVENDGPELEADIVVEVNLVEVAKQLGLKALKSKGKKAQEMSGLVLVKAVNIRPKK